MFVNFVALIASYASTGALPCRTGLEKCEIARHNLTKCAACVEEIVKEGYNCSRAEAETFCHPAPTPNSTKCRAGLEDFCRKDRSSPSLCRECVEEHAQALRELSCTTTEEAQFCTSPKPGPAPVDKCEVELREDCENDRANITLCRKCIELHADPLKAAGCTEDVEVKFCEHTPVPPPAPPTAKCVAALAEYCEPDKHNETLCVRCCEDHRNQTRDAGCTWSAYEFFCKVAPRPRPPGPAPPTPPRVCPAKLEALCGEERKNETRCVHCIEENIAALKAADCTETEEHEFCKPHPAPKESCADAFYALCPRSSWKSNATKCMHCAEEHEEALKAKDCTIAEIDTLCHVAPPPAPGPRGCERALAEECEKDRRNATLCAGCIVNHKEILGKAGCTAIEEEEFCKKTPPPPESHTCGRELVELCDKARKNATACAACEVKNEAALAAAKCTYAEKEEFCHPAPLKPTCENELFELCDADRKNLTKCHACLASHAATFKKVNCTAAEEAAFCAPKPPVAPTCEHELYTECGEVRHDLTKCKACLAAHAAVFEKAHCTEAEETAFCKATPVPPNPHPSNSSCIHELYELCETDKHNATKCHACVTVHAAELNKAHCTAAAEAEFCHGTPAPVVTCAHELAVYCTEDKKDETKCKDCITAHAAELEKVHCTATEEAAFCKPVTVNKATVARAQL